MIHGISQVGILEYLPQLACLYSELYLKNVVRLFAPPNILWCKNTNESLILHLKKCLGGLRKQDLLFLVISLLDSNLQRSLICTIF